MWHQPWTHTLELSIASDLLLFHQNIPLEIDHGGEGVHVSFPRFLSAYREEVRVVGARDEKEVGAACGRQADTETNEPRMKCACEHLCKRSAAWSEH